MSKWIKLDVPDATHAALKSKAALARKTLKQWLRELIERAVR